MPNETSTLTLRLDQDDLHNLDAAASHLCNTRAGTIRFAIRNLKEVLGIRCESEHPENDQQEGLPCA
jgi:hypothetical protein